MFEHTYEAIKIGWEFDWLEIDGCVPWYDSRPELIEKWKDKVSRTPPAEWYDFLNNDVFFSAYFDNSDYFSESLIGYLENHICEDNCYVLERFSSSDYMILSDHGPRPVHNLHGFPSLDFTKNLLEKDNHTDKELTFLTSIIFEAVEYDAGRTIDGHRDIDSSIIFKIAEIMLNNNCSNGLDKLASVCIWADEGYYSEFSDEKPLEKLLIRINSKLGTNYTRSSGGPDPNYYDEYGSPCR